jgi:hypothetical protein
MQWWTGVRARPIATIRRAIAEFDCNPSKKRGLVENESGPTPKHQYLLIVLPPDGFSLRGCHQLFPENADSCDTLVQIIHFLDWYVLGTKLCPVTLVLFTSPPGWPLGSVASTMAVEALRGIHCGPRGY